MSKELFYQIMKKPKALETGDNTWEGQETSGTWLQKCLNTRQVFRSFFLPDMPVCHRHLSRWGKNTSSLLNFINRHFCLKGKKIIQHKAWGWKNVLFHKHPGATYKQNLLICWGRCCCDALREGYRKYFITVLCDFVSLLKFILLSAWIHQMLWRLCRRLSLEGKKREI